MNALKLPLKMARQLSGGARGGRVYFFLGFLGFRERLLALHSGQMGALRWICWWHDRHDFMGGGCCLQHGALSGHCSPRAHSPTLTPAIQQTDSASHLIANLPTEFISPWLNKSKPSPQQT
ncbi:jg429 [Pararge aegeria aegeria]|uniref:Jg429 protein n=1 Tax=Pararge aegeria aegeria TaxID=348720 RepID=A0A8S4QS87_9NEOP|nr:jg429 [Pararge aegeria aegeria]